MIEDDLIEVQVSLQQWYKEKHQPSYKEAEPCHHYVRTMEAWERVKKLAKIGEAAENLHCGGCKKKVLAPSIYYCSNECANNE